MTRYQATQSLKVEIQRYRDIEIQRYRERVKIYLMLLNLVIYILTTWLYVNNGNTYFENT